MNKDPKGLDTWSGAGTEFGGFLGFGGISTMYSFITNWRSGEKCYLETRCYKVGLGIGGGVSAINIWVLDGPSCGKGLTKSSIGIGVEGGFVGYVSSSPAGTVGTSPEGGYGITGGAGIGAGFMEYVYYCTTRVISCENTPNFCKCEDK